MYENSVKQSNRPETASSMLSQLAPPPDAAEKVPQVTEQLYNLLEQLTLLHGLTASLETKLHPILFEDAGGCYDVAPHTYLVPTADTIYDFTDRVIYQNAKLRSLIRRIEV